jgi:proteasome beta subunit
MKVREKTMKQNLENYEEVLKTGTTIIGIVCEDAVVMGSESKATMGNLITSKDVKKIYKVDDRLAFAFAGGVGDGQYLLRIFRAETKIQKMRAGRAMTVKAASTMLTNIMRGTFFYAAPIISGYDNAGCHVFSADMMGGLAEHKDFFSYGSGSPFALGVLEDSYHENMSSEDGIDAVVRSLEAAKARDIGSGFGNQIVRIDENGYSDLTEDPAFSDIIAGKNANSRRSK